MLTIDGLVSGLDTESIIEGLLEIQQKQIDLLESRKTKITAKQGAFTAIQAQLQTLRSGAATLSRSVNSVFDANLANVSDEDALLATASNKATSGVFQVTINALAQAEQVATQGFADEDAPITQGTLTLQVGNGSAATVTIDSTNDTLQGLATAINNSDAGVSASIIQDGSSGGTPFRLLLTSEKTGASQQISITNNLAASGGGATQPVFDTGNPVQAAADASITLGNGPGAITVFSDTNTVNNLINGVSLTLRQADAAKTISVSIEADTEPATTAVNEFVDSFNTFANFISNLSSYDTNAEQGGVLLGNRNATSTLQSVRSAVLDAVSGLGGDINRLTAIGVSVEDDGTLSFSESKLADILSGRDPDIDPDEVKRLFALDGQSTNGSVRFIAGTTRT